MTRAMALLEVSDLKASFRTDDGVVRAVDGVSFTVERGKVLGIVGESGSGKSVTCLSLLRLTPPRRTTVSGHAIFKGRDLLALSEHELQAVRGREIAMIFQDPMTSLNPVRTIEFQLVEAIELHERIGKEQARVRARDMLRAVGIPNPEDRLKAYPMEFSGGMRQRVMIAMALINRPDLLIADEPTTALDVTTQAQVLRLLRELRHEVDAAIILITHDLGVIADLCDDVLVMYAGRVVERAQVDDLFATPSHPYTWGLLSSLPAMNTGARRIRSIQGSPPSLLATPPGCAFHPRCPFVMERCRIEVPALVPTGPDAEHLSACHLPLDRREEERTRLFDRRGSGPADAGNAAPAPKGAAQ
jgi:peptide/nickel transport system ATP-binding protein